MEKNPYLRLVAAVLFAAVCAYVGAALYPRLSPKQAAAPVMAEKTEKRIHLEGIALRHEQALSSSEAGPMALRDGERLSGAAVLAAMTGEDSGSGCGSCVFLDYSDGLEELSVDQALPLSVSRVRRLMALEASPKKDGGRLVSGFDWYYAAVTDYRGALPEGSCVLRFEGFDKELKGRLVEVSGFESGERALLFRLMIGDTDYLKLRNVSAELIVPG